MTTPKEPEGAEPVTRAELETQAREVVEALYSPRSQCFPHPDSVAARRLVATFVAFAESALRRSLETR